MAVEESWNQMKTVVILLLILLVLMLYFFPEGTKAVVGRFVTAFAARG